MPNAKVHQQCGAFAGGTTAFFEAISALPPATVATLQRIQQPQSIWDQIWEVVSTVGKIAAKTVVGAVAGALAARLPDILEPATHPNHRKAAHSVTALLVVIFAFVKRYPDHPLSILIKPALAGYGSHLVLDARTPKRIPIL